jgi:hypothetical protein
MRVCLYIIAHARGEGVAAVPVANLLSISPAVLGGHEELVL